MELSSQEALLKQWEPKVHAMLHHFRISSDIYEDYAQELRICILNANKNWTDGGGASFHTYLHICMRNALIYQINKNKNGERPDSLEANPTFKNQLSLLEDLTLLCYIPKLTLPEIMVLDMLLCGKNEYQIITISVNKSSSKHAIASLRRKMEYLRNEQNSMFFQDTFVDLPKGGKQRTPRSHKNMPELPEKAGIKCY